MALLLLAAAGCAEEAGEVVIGDRDSDTAVVLDTDTAGADSGSADSAVPCTNELLSLEPRAGDDDVLLSVDILAQLQQAEVGAGIKVFEDDVQLPGVVEAEGKLIRWRPQSPLRADSAYRTELTWSCGTVNAAWTTTGRTFRLGLASGTLALPATDLALGDVFSELLVRVEVYGAGRVSLLAAPAGASGQEPCAASSLLGGVVAPGGDLEVASADAFLVAAGQRIPVNALRVVSALQASRWRLEPATVVFDVDLSPLATTLLGRVDATPAEACARVGGCTSCRGSGGRTCVTVRLEDVPVAGSSQLVEPRSAADVGRDPSCR